MFPTVRDAHHPLEAVSATDTGGRPSRRHSHWLLHSVIVVLALSIVYLGYVLYTTEFAPPVDNVPSGFTPAGKPIQIDVLNGCGISGAASNVTAHLRRKGFDVVEMRNYTSFTIRETIVIDRVGNLEQAHRVARALGVERRNVIQEINYDYYVDVSVVVGRDYPSLKEIP